VLISKFDNTDIERLIDEYEAKRKFIFPEQYKVFLLKYNGGSTPVTKFKIGKTSSDLKGFYGLGGADKHLNYTMYDSMDRIGDFLEDEMLPIGDTMFGDYILIGVGADNNGKVYYLYHDRPKRYIKLTEDFKAFVDACKSEILKPPRTIEERKAAMIANGLGDKINPIGIAEWQKGIDRYAAIHQEELVL
jgi:hypothetical protein